MNNHEHHLTRTEILNVEQRLADQINDAARQLLANLRRDAGKDQLGYPLHPTQHNDSPLRLRMRAQKAEQKVRAQHESIQALGQQYEEAKEQQRVETERANCATQSHVAERDRRRTLEQQYEDLKATIEREREGKEKLLAKLKEAEHLLARQRSDLERYRGITDRPQPSTGMRYETIRPLDPEDAGWIVIDMRPATGCPVAITTNLLMQEAVDLTAHLNS